MVIQTSGSHVIRTTDGHVVARCFRSQRSHSSAISRLLLLARLGAGGELEQDQAGIAGIPVPALLLRRFLDGPTPAGDQGAELGVQPLRQPRALLIEHEDAAKVLEAVRAHAGSMEESGSD